MTGIDFHLGSIDRHVADLSDEEIWQLCLDGDQLDRNGAIGECLLRNVAAKWVESHQPNGGILALRMIEFVHAAHKHRSMRLAALENRPEAPEV